MQLRDVRIVLVRPRGPRNVGMAARAIANHGLGGLVLVAPAALDPDEARWMAPGAKDIVDEAPIVATIDEAVADCRLVIGATARRRRYRWPVWSPGRLADEVLDRAGPAAVLFGPEHAGLSNDDLARCHALLTLPTGEASSLNLAQAVTVTAHALRARLAERQADPRPDPKTAPAAVLGRLSDAATDVLRLGGYLSGRSEAQVRGTLFRLLSRLEATEAEAGMLSGMLSQLRWTLEHPPQPGGGRTAPPADAPRGVVERADRRPEEAEPRPDAPSGADLTRG